MVEQLAARLLKRSDIRLEMNALVPTASGRGNPREIDILVTLNVPFGQRLTYAVECKNERKPIEAQYIDAFIGKLQHVGIPAENGIFVSRSCYRQGAVLRAREAGIRTLRVSGLRDDGLTDAIFEAVQSVIWLIANAQQINIVSDSPDGNIQFCTDDGTFAGTVCDLIYRSWRNGQIPHHIGLHVVTLDVPDHWKLATTKGPANVIEVNTEVSVTGVAYTVHGEMTAHALVDQPTGLIARGRARAEWDVERHHVELCRIYTAEELEAHCASLPGLLRLVVKNRPLPRINDNSSYGRMYWPPSEEVVQTLYSRMMKGEPLGSPDEDFEGQDFTRLFEDPFEGYAPVW